MKEFLKKHKSNILSWIIGFAIGILINIPTCKKIEPKIEYIECHDTLTIEKERIVEHTRPIFITDTLIKVDSVYVSNDGTYVELPMTWSQYKDTIKNDSTEAYIEIDHHGVVSEIDKVYFDYKYNKEILTIVKEPKRVGLVWAIGPSLGYSITANPMNGQINHGVSAGLTLTLGIGGIIK